MIIQFPRRAKSDRRRSSREQVLKTAVDQIIQGDALEVLKTFPDECVDLIVTDPPYGYSFMNKDWDRAVPSVEIWAECLRVLKPGTVMFVMSSPRQDCLWQMLGNLRQAGFRLNFTSIYWAYSSGLPKAANIALLADRKLGAKRRKVGKGGGADKRYFQGFEPGKRYDPTPLTAAAAALDGSYAGFQPKPAVEVIIVAMKPLAEKTFVEQALKNQKGITWMDEARIPDDSSCRNGSRSAVDRGRFPANLLISDRALHPKENFSQYFSLDAWWEKKLADLPEEVRRSFPFLVVSKTSPSEKDAGLQFGENIHPTVKPLKLMSFLVTLGSRPGDLVLDPFVGSGTTCVIARLLDRHCIGIEREADYAQIAAKRLEIHAKKLSSGLHSRVGNAQARTR